MEVWIHGQALTCGAGSGDIQPVPRNAHIHKYRVYTHTHTHYTGFWIHGQALTCGAGSGDIQIMYEGLWHFTDFRVQNPVFGRFWANFRGISEKREKVGF